MARKAAGKNGKAGANGAAESTAAVQPVILSGGSGTRLWPMSRALYPKQLLPLASERSMLQETALRFAGEASFGPPLVICNEEHRFIIAEQLRDIRVEAAGIVLEPVGRNTAPAAAVAALLQAEPSGLLLVLPADHAIADVAAFRQAVAAGAELAREGWLVTFGVTPSRAETGYGYIQRGKKLANGFAVDRFVEKPDAKTAERYLAAGDYLWNSGIFLFRADRYLAELKKRHGAMIASCKTALDNGARDLDFLRLEKTAFAAAASDSIDYAVMEHTEKAAVIPVSVGWSDVGAWNALWDISAKDDAGNVLIGDVLNEGSSGCYVRGEKTLIATLGLKDTIVVETTDAVLVADKARAGDVKLLVDRLAKSNRPERLTHARVYRPWGWYQTIEAGERFQVKHIMVKPGQALSLQMHHHRAEHWVVVTGTAVVAVGEKEQLLSENESVYIPIGTTHRLSNPGKLPLRLIEVQSGAYLGEDDIVRFEDRYGRMPAKA
jgi:mannose-1-phosphate guanylyltransferase/mannose-6-phosphate isomerase